MLNPASPLPLYHQLAALLSEQIASGQLSIGARLPSEPELSREHGIGRPTVRQATELLVQRGLIERRRGSGTYVRKAEQRVDLFSLAGTLSSFQKGGIEIESRLVRNVRKRRIPDDAENPFSGREAYHFQRLSSVKGRPVLCEELFLDPEVFPDLASVPLSGVSLAQVVQERYYLRPTHAEQSFRVSCAPLAVCKVLGVSPTFPVLLVKRTLFFPRAERAIFSELYCRTDELVFSQTLSTEPHHG
ncbi:MAG TPA: GntR family transcriptional regulator [Polyangiaceae bacterium]|nr:GntR family transcriptional regulator [Polyangiaceae bacterium]HYQ30999.1 GntR family transcriptional regulator [Polyangiaceae bacterium]